MYKAYNMEILGKRAVVINLNKERAGLDGVHYIHILDIEDVKMVSKLKETLNYMGENDLITIILSSGKVLIKGSQNHKGLESLLDSLEASKKDGDILKSLNVTDEIIDELKVMCDKFAVILYTDGLDSNGLMETIDKINKKVVSFNVVGYGNDYDRNDLLNITGNSQFGVLVHSDDLDDFVEVFKDIQENIKELCKGDLNINVPGADILYVSDKNTKLSKNEMKTDFLNRGNSSVVIIVDNDVKLDVNNDVIISNDIDVMDEENILNIKYAYAYELAYEGRRLEALEVLREIGDKHLIDKHLDTFTHNEFKIYLDDLKEARDNPEKRFLDGEIKNEVNEGISVFDVLEKLVKGDNYYCYSKNKESYSRISRKSIDEGNYFKAHDGEIYSSFSGLVFSKDKLNISIRLVIPGVVELDENKAKAVDLNSKIDSRIYRNHNIIRDGILNMNEIEVLLDKNTLNELNIEGNFVKDLGNVNYEGKTYTKAILELSKLPVVSQIDKYNKTEDILNLVINRDEEIAKNKVIKHYLDELTNKEGTYKTFMGGGYTPEQVDVLSEHGLDKFGNYVGVDRKLADRDDFYEVRKIEFQIKGQANIPSVNAVLKKIRENKKLNNIDKVLKGYLDDFKIYEDDREILETMLRESNKVLNLINLRLNSIKISKILTGDWFDNVDVDKKGNYVYAGDKGTLVIKANREKVYV